MATTSATQNENVTMPIPIHTMPARIAPDDLQDLPLDEAINYCRNIHLAYRDKRREKGGYLWQWDDAWVTVYSRVLMRFKTTAAAQRLKDIAKTGGVQGDPEDFEGGEHWRDEHGECVRHC